MIASTSLEYADRAPASSSAKLWVCPLSPAREEVARLLGSVRETRYRMLFDLIYGCGLRVGEAVKLEVRDIKRSDHRLHIRQGKGNKDR